MIKKLCSEERSRAESAEAEVASLKTQLAKAQEQLKATNREVERLKQ